MDNVPRNEFMQEFPNIELYVKRLIKILEELKFYYENTDNSSGVEIAKEW